MLGGRPTPKTTGWQNVGATLCIEAADVASRCEKANIELDGLHRVFQGRCRAQKAVMDLLSMIDEAIGLRSPEPFALKLA